MNKDEIVINTERIHQNSEATSTVSNISYEIENARARGLSDIRLKEQLNTLETEGHFPSNLDYKVSYTDEETGLSASVFVDKHTGKAIVGMAGTNRDTDLLKDLYADVNIGLLSVTARNKYFENMNKFLDKVESEYEIDTITGHSKGGRDALVLGSYRNIENIITYNAAPITIKNTRVESNPFFNTIGYVFPTSNFSNYMKERKRENELNDRFIKQIFKDYKGNILRVSSSSDLITIFSDLLDGTTFGKSMTIQNGKGHSMENFLRGKEQGIINKEIYKMKNNEEKHVSMYKEVIKVTKRELHKIDDMKQRLIQQSGGILSSSQLKFLEYHTALTIVKGLDELLKEELKTIHLMYVSMKAQLQNVWEEGREDAADIGRMLSDSEQLEALHRGNAYYTHIVKEPHEKIENKIKKLGEIGEHYAEYIKKIEQSIEAIIAHDQMLASQIGGES